MSPGSRYVRSVSRERLVRRIEIEARAYVSAKGSRDAMILGRVYGLLEAGTLEGYWRTRRRVHVRRRDR